ncbi:tyrosine-type recombinase/integrase [Halalkalibacter krulwichiae]|uniref:Site-specific tyrosine recombinase XerC n=1 Tax=Halalkalibacter krulwichiae TaxID=199441 RepID=A0A1X9ME55_9BACI|nr:phage integrase N-terminal SAM-like domain-containing protein [Halalkalibacter krulwichiae]ARK30914.1 site-specific tyrosine recombinase XerC [Halalkalibacter krulwichiae]
MNNLFPSFIEYYIAELRQRGRKPSTIKRYLYDLNDFSFWLHKKRATTDSIDWKTITKEELELFFSELVEKRNYHIRTVRRIHSVLRQLHRYQKSHHQTELAPIELIDPPELVAETLEPSDWITKKEEQQLLKTMRSTDSLSDQQIETFPFYKERNEFIVRLFLHYGLSLHEVHELSMNNLKFERNELLIFDTIETRTIKLKEEDKQLAYTYFKTIPEPVRPRYYSNDPFIVAFDFKRKTFHWSYDNDEPKRMSMIAIQKMVRTEVKRASLRKGISAQTLRNTFILSTLIRKNQIENLIATIGYTTPLSLNRYLQTVESFSQEQINELILAREQLTYKKEKAL